MTASVVTTTMRQVAEQAMMRTSWCIDSALSNDVDNDVAVSMRSVAKMLLLAAVTVTTTTLQRLQRSGAVRFIWMENGLFNHYIKPHQSDEGMADDWQSASVVNHADIQTQLIIRPPDFELPGQLYVVVNGQTRCVMKNSQYSELLMWSLVSHNTMKHTVRVESCPLTNLLINGIL